MTMRCAGHETGNCACLFAFGFWRWLGRDLNVTPIVHVLVHLRGPIFEMKLCWRRAQRSRPATLQQDARLIIKTQLIMIPFLHGNMYATSDMKALENTLQAGQRTQQIPCCHTFMTRSRVTCTTVCVSGGAMAVAVWFAASGETGCGVQSDAEACLVGGANALSQLQV